MYLKKDKRSDCIYKSSIKSVFISLWLNLFSNLIKLIIYLQTFLKKCEYKIKEEWIKSPIIDDLESSCVDDSNIEKILRNILSNL